MHKSIAILSLAVLLAMVSGAAALEAEANHILVADEARCNEIKGKINAAGDVFAEVRMFLRCSVCLRLPMPILSIQDVCGVL